jgi:hypothetical protein
MDRHCLLQYPDGSFKFKVFGIPAQQPVEAPSDFVAVLSETCNFKN